MFQNYKDCLFNSKVILKSQQRFKRDHHKDYKEEVNKIALSCDDDKSNLLSKHLMGLKHTQTEQQMKC